MSIRNDLPEVIAGDHMDHESSLLVTLFCRFGRGEILKFALDLLGKAQFSSISHFLERPICSPSFVRQRPVQAEDTCRTGFGVPVMAVTLAFQTSPQKRRIGRGSCLDGLSLVDLPKLGAGRRSESGGEPGPL